jgi:hypothetical protein
MTSHKNSEAILIATTLVLLASAAGCSLFCGPSPSCVSATLEVAVTDADTGAAVDEARIQVVGEDGTTQILGDTDTMHWCTGGPPGCKGVWFSGKGHVAVSATGYVGAEFDVNVPDDVCGRPVAQLRKVALAKSGSPGPAVVSDGVATAGCR